MKKSKKNSICENFNFQIVNGQQTQMIAADHSHLKIQTIAGKSGRIRILFKNTLLQLQL
jgi:hypothetical protein